MIANKKGVRFSESVVSGPHFTSIGPNFQPAQSTIAKISMPLDTESRSEYSLSQHGYETAALENHQTLEEPTTGFDNSTSPESHQHSLNAPDHQQIQGPTPFSCLVCLASFPSRSQLEVHAKQSAHDAFACSCGQSFQRLDALVRHQRSFRQDIHLFPCTFCKRHRGKQGFRRRDHLVQHLSGYHKFNSDKIVETLPKQRHSSDFVHCIYPGCELNPSEWHRHDYSEQPRVYYFTRRSDYTKHLREVHEITPFPCPITECKRVGSKGYSSRHGLVKHLAREHEASPESLVPEEYVRGRKCDHCGKRLLRLDDFNIHHQVLHQS
ncbi:uncharacterized protein F4807DRAFT_57968 [Annulohypoxylon truncatum]|uniref:uncharacterized protein n=1 Tax=Annulohypoxylon truncatum TaxID=327061 RepID=UPI002008E297|nr:uncharacterized protein F4807DRAFT_57968 [Annulohypoxylon truncatum]KAI1210755.1 hypothetical protein F4807DRAFT_57968 [Annulohypoxylon truncatum]